MQISFNYKKCTNALVELRVNKLSATSEQVTYLTVFWRKNFFNLMKTQLAYSATYLQSRFNTHMYNPATRLQRFQLLIMWFFHTQHSIFLKIYFRKQD